MIGVQLVSWALLRPRAVLAAQPSAWSGVGWIYATDHHRPPPPTTATTDRLFPRLLGTHLYESGWWCSDHPTHHRPPKFIITYARGFCQEKLFSKIHYVVVGLALEKISSKKFCTKKNCRTFATSSNDERTLTDWKQIPEYRANYTLLTSRVR